MPLLTPQAKGGGLGVIIIPTGAAEGSIIIGVMGESIIGDATWLIIGIMEGAIITKGITHGVWDVTGHHIGGSRAGVPLCWT